jgi:hypothetical protein
LVCANLLDAFNQKILLSHLNSFVQM